MPRIPPALAACWALGAFACGGQHDEAAHLRGEKKVLEREVEGLRTLAGLLERGDPVIPLEDVVVVLDESLLGELLAAQLPFEADLDRYHIRLTGAEAMFRGSPQVRLRGTLALRENPDLAGVVSVLGALEQMAVDEASETLSASVGVDHIEIEKAAGLETLLSHATLDGLARALRLRISQQLPTLSIPVKVRQRIQLPALRQGPVRIDGAELPLQASVSRVLAGQGRLWIGIRLQPGDLARTGEASPGTGR